MRKFDFAFLVFATTVALQGLGEDKAVQPLTQAHSHNDYEHKRPLLDALDQGFCSVEADIYLVSGKLLVAHDRDQVKPDRTLESLYLEPLRERVQKNNGRVYRGGPEVSLLIDLKTPWTSTYPVLRQVLEQYKDILTTFEDGQRRPGAVLAILSGDRSKEMFAREKVRYAAYDGTLADLEAPESALLAPWISSNWRSTFKWDGQAEMPAEERAKLKTLVGKAHARGQRVRLWGAPDTPAFWKVLLENGVDLVNTDHLPELRRFLAQNN